MTVKNVIISFNSMLKDARIRRDISRFMSMCVCVWQIVRSALREREFNFGWCYHCDWPKSNDIFPFKQKQANLIGFILDLIRFDSGRRFASFLLLSCVRVRVHMINWLIWINIYHLFMRTLQTASTVSDGNHVDLSRFSIAPRSHLRSSLSRCKKKSW